MRAIYVVMVTVVLLETCEGRVRARAKDVPACYRDPGSGSLSPCSNPLYSDCGDGLCCGPDHHCCTYGSIYKACCRVETWSSYEITGIVTGIVAWIGNMIVIFTCVTPQVVRKIKRSCFKKNKIKPVDSGAALELQHHRKHF